jgi:hypothetical protein
LLSSGNFPAAEAYLQVQEEHTFTLPPGTRDAHPDVWQTGWVNLRTVAGAACGTYNCSLVSFEIYLFWDKHQLEEQFFRKRAKRTLRFVLDTPPIVDLSRENSHPMTKIAPI